MPEETVVNFQDAGLFRILQPARVGGLELDYGLLYEVGAVVSRVCASSGWHGSNLASHHWMLAMWPNQGQAEVWGKNNVTAERLLPASVCFPTGTGKRVNGRHRPHEP